MSNSSNEFIKLLKHPVKFRMFLFYKLPAAFFSGVRIRSIDESKCTTSVPYKWLTQNPFKSTYFASLAMAAELSTGALGLSHIYKRKPSISMLVVKMEANYFKKAIGKTYFTCEAGQQIRETIEAAIATGEGKLISVKTIGANEAGEIVAEFLFTWSFKAKQTKT
ncbi:MAG: PaaI family thioesterase [Chitinophagaceae bacterium]